MTEALFGLLGLIVGCLVTIYISHIDRRASFKLAAIDKKLQVHQAAYRLWSHLLSTLYSPILRQAAYRQCSYWWVNNCLYLEKKVRNEFYTVLRSIPSFQPDYHKQTERDKEIYKRAEALLDLIADAVNLPPTGNLPADFKKEGTAMLGSFSPSTIFEEVNKRFDSIGNPIESKD